MSCSKRRALRLSGMFLKPDYANWSICRYAVPYCSGCLDQREERMGELETNTLHCIFVWRGSDGKEEFKIHANHDPGTDEMTDGKAQGQRPERRAGWRPDWPIGLISSGSKLPWRGVPTRDATTTSIGFPLKLDLPENRRTTQRKVSFGRNDTT